MKDIARQMLLFLLTLLLMFEMGDVASTSSCNPAVLKLYGWCEQWACNNSCRCVARQDCRQYCDVSTCRDMRCLSPSICKQKVHISGKTVPHVLNMFARAPFVTQDCSGGRCDVMRAKGPWKKSGTQGINQKGMRKYHVKGGATIMPVKKIPFAALQNCVGGVCQRVISTLQISKQFCTECAKMHCMGRQATNCTQVCAVGSCRQVLCESKDCQQACLQNASCTMKCGKEVATCLQICEKGSVCKMHCDAKNCRQICGNDNDQKCERFRNGKRMQTLINVNSNVSRKSNNDTKTEIPDFTNLSMNISTLKPTTFKQIILSNSIKLHTYPTKQNSAEEDFNHSLNLKARKESSESVRLSSSLLHWMFLAICSFVVLGELAS